MINLQLTDGAFIIDNSGLEKLKCPRLFELSFVKQREAVAERAGANFGSTIHRGLEVRYHTCGPNEVIANAQADIDHAMRLWLDENPQPVNDFRDLSHAMKVMRTYNQIYRNESFKILTNQDGKPIIEASFMLPFAYALPCGTNWSILPWLGETIEGLKALGATPIYYSGKIDLGIEDHNGIWSFDHKTAFQFGETFDKQMQMDGGQLGYCWALGQVLGRKPQGYIIDAIRVRRPTKADAILGGAPCDATDFKRMPFYVSDDMLDEWKKDTLRNIKSIFDYAASGHFPRYRWQCTNKFGVCEFFDVCSSRRQDREQILASGLFEDSKWRQGLKTANNENKESK